jgi:CheY-like chemotaxis protein
MLEIDDNITNKFIIKQIRGKLGYSFNVVENRQFAIETVVGDESFEVFLFNQFMLIIDGPSAACTIKAFDVNIGSITIIAMTASSFQEDKEMCKATSRTRSSSS